MRKASTSGRRAGSSRRQVLAWMPGAAACLGATGEDRRPAPIRIAISENVVADVNLNDARAAMLVWTKLITQHIDITVECSPNVFETTAELVNRVQRGQVDAVAVNVVEYRQISRYLDVREVVAAAGEAGRRQYLILVRDDSGIRHLEELRGRRLIVWKTPQMCVAPAWLSTQLSGVSGAGAEGFFRAVTTESKVSRVVLPVFFGQSEACLTTKRGYDMMCELNPQVGKALRVLKSSPAMVVFCYLFRKNYASVQRERLVKALSSLSQTAAGRQLAALFQFEAVALRDASCLASALEVLEMAERGRIRVEVGRGKGQL